MMIPGVHLEVFLAAAYALFLVGAAALLERLARHSHQRANRYQASGFVYHQHLDQWECPMGQPLTRSGIDDERRTVRYRAPARSCNSCSLKNNCTDSDQGRVLEQHLDSWIQSELRKFHRGFSLALLLLAIVILVAQSVRHAEPRELALLLILLVPISIAETKFLIAFRASRARSHTRLEPGGR